MPRRIAVLASFVLAASLTVALAPATRASAQTLPTPPTTSRTERPELSVAAQSVAGDGLLWPASAPEGAVHRPRIARGLDEGWIIAGAIAFGAGYVAGIVLGIAEELSSTCAGPPLFVPGRCGTWPLAFIPIGGAFASALATFDGSTRTSPTLLWIYAPYTVAAQLAGATFLLFALSGYTERVVPAAEVAGMELRFAPIASITEGGISMAMDF